MGGKASCEGGMMAYVFFAAYIAFGAVALYLAMRGR